VQVGGFYAYNLYDDCWYQNGLEPPHHPVAPRQWWGPPRKGAVGAKRREGMMGEVGGGGGAVPDDPNGYLCGGPQAMFEWIETEAVRSALHVDSDAVFFSGDNGAGFTYNLTEPNLMPFYRHLAVRPAYRGKESCVYERAVEMPNLEDLRSPSLGVG
jgi:hypothetical protein